MDSFWVILVNVVSFSLHWSISIRVVQVKHFLDNFFQRVTIQRSNIDFKKAGLSSRNIVRN